VISTSLCSRKKKGKKKEEVGGFQKWHSTKNSAGK
jgi:hypothetical protein